MLAVLFIMIILLAVLALIVVNALKASPWGLFTIACTIPIALLMGWWMKRWRPGKVGEASAAGPSCYWARSWRVAGCGAAALAPLFTHSATALTGMMVAYGFIASVLPVWMLLCPRDYLSTFLKITTILVLAVAILVILPRSGCPRSRRSRRSGGSGVRGEAVSVRVHHDRVRGDLGIPLARRLGTTPKMIARESDARLIGYGGMLMESFVA